MKLTLTSIAKVHDDIPAFHIAYAVVTFLVAAMLSLGWFLVLIGCHACLDTIKYREIHKLSALKTLHAVLYENLFDVVLFFLALLVSVFFQSNADFVHASAFIRIEISLVRFLGIVIPKYMLLDRFVAKVLHLHAFIEHLLPAKLYTSFGIKEKVYTGFVVASCILLLVAPYILQTDASVIAAVIEHELRLWHL